MTRFDTKIKDRGVMVDIETFGQSPSSAIASIAAVEFPFFVEDPLAWLAEAISEKKYFYKIVDLNSQGMREFDGPTIKWWMMQSDASRQAITSDGSIPLEAALRALIEWYPAGCWVFSKGATFDLVILDHAFRQLELRGRDNEVGPPWAYNQGLCARTVYELSGVGQPKIDVLSSHNALDDALLQAVWFQRAIKELVVPVPKAPEEPSKE